ncbi:MAG: hypothetical protein KF830_14100 [Planctomycetes bacterium]|nr:hypothetical protein [Planctomycetota bacterium]
MRPWQRLAAGALVAVAAAPAQDAPPDTAALARLLARLDAHLAAGDVAAYLAEFEPDHPGAHACLRHQLEQRLACGPGARRSTVVVPPRPVGDRSVLRVRHQFEAAGAVPAFHEDAMLAVRRRDDGRWVPTFTVEIPAASSCVRDDRFHCPPCNYEVGGVDGWLCVPVPAERAQALEAASFYLVGTDVACDVSVLVDAGAPTAATIARELGNALAALEPSARPGPVEAWLPPAHGGAPPDGLTAARVEVRLPRDFEGRGGVARFHVVAFGGLQHLLLLRGSAAALQTHAAAAQALLASYHLLEQEADLSLAAARPLHHHTGGQVTGNRYTNDRYDFVFDGPDGWRVEQRCGGAALRVVWASPSGSRLWLTGYAAPPGLRHWCEATADRWLQQLLRRAGLEADAPDDGWDGHADCGRLRRVRCKAAVDGPDSPRERTLHVVLHGDLLLVADLAAVTAADAATMLAAVGSLRRR